MFSGIVEATGRIKKVESHSDVLRISVEKPINFNDLCIGDSVAVDGVCLTVEGFDLGSIAFALGPETLQITGWSNQGVLNRVVNLERSLRLQDRLHGHLVTGHVDAMGQILKIQDLGETRQMLIRFPQSLQSYIWSKGSVAVNGVSLTLNQVEGDTFSVGLIPETMRRTNLGVLCEGQSVTLEIDNMARGLVHIEKLQRETEL